MKRGVMLILFLTSCIGRGELNFNSDPTIFRGTWIGQTQAYVGTQTSTLRMDLTATYVSRSMYTVLGTLTFADDTAVEVSGRVFGAGWEIYVQADEQPSWWVSSNLDLRVKDALKDTGQVSCAWTTDFEAKQCSLSISSGMRMGNYKILNLVRRTSTN
jgi:hypothetical protein